MVVYDPFSISDTWIVSFWNSLLGWLHRSRSSRKNAQGTGSFCWIWNKLTFTSRKPPPQSVLEICLRGSGLSIHSPPLWAVPGSPHFYEVHGCGSFPTETDGNLHPELPRRLANFGPVGGRVAISQIRAPQPLRVPRTQGQCCQEHAVLQPTNFVPGNSYRLSPNEGSSHTRMCTGHSAARGFIQTLHSKSLALSKRFKGCWAWWPQRLR